MDLEQGSQVRIMFRNGVSIEGIIFEWNHISKSYKVTADDGFFVIQNPSEDIIVVKVILEKNESASKADNNVIKLEDNVQQLKMDFQEVYDHPSEEDGKLDVQSLASLRAELVKTDKQLMAQKLRQHHIKEQRGVKYGQPGFLKKQSS